jgi:hypothetical protein
MTFILKIPRIFIVERHRNRVSPYLLFMIIRYQAIRNKLNSYEPSTGVRYDSRIYEIIYCFDSRRFASKYLLRNKANLKTEIFTSKYQLHMNLNMKYTWTRTEMETDKGIYMDMDTDRNRNRNRERNIYAYIYSRSTPTSTFRWT